MAVATDRLLMNACPDLYAELHIPKNLEAGIEVETLSAGNPKKVWWQCKKEPSHYWPATVNSRSGKSKAGCGMCANSYIVHGLNDLSVRNPKIYSELHSSLNIENNIDTKTLSLGSSTEVWWQCNKVKKHFWKSPVDNRTRSQALGCSMCSKRYTVHGVNDLSVEFPDLYAELHPTLNKSEEMKGLATTSPKKVWWQCKKDPTHYWPASISGRTGKAKKGCSMCNSQYIVYGINDLSVANPSLYSEIHPTLNDTHGIDTTVLSPNSNKKIWWQCKKDPTHYWPAWVNNRAKKINPKGCGMCVSKYVVHGINDLSALRPDLYAELHPDLNTTYGIDTANLPVYANKKVWWQCSINLNHHWPALVSERAGLNNTGCPMCKGLLIKHGINDLSALEPDLYSELHATLNDKYDIDTTLLSVGSDKKVWWQCRKKSVHYWEAYVYSRTGSGRTGCAMCRGFYVVHGVNDLSVEFPKLYAELHPYLNAENKIDTTILSAFSTRKVWWQCKKDDSHFWEAVVYTRSSSMNTGCPHCVTYRNESDFRHLFSTVTNLSFASGQITGERELFKRDKIQIDMINHENKVIIEYDGCFSHGGNELYKTTAEGCLARDIDTTATLLREGYKVIRIRETPLKYIPTRHPNLIQVHYKERDDKLPVIEKCVKALQKIGVDIELNVLNINGGKLEVHKN